jgi:hypothetical protein
VADFAVRFNDFSGGDWGDTDPAKAKVNQFSGKNVVPYGSGLLGVRPGLKLLDLTGKVPGGAPASYTGIVRGFDLMRNRLTLVLDTKSYDIYWDLALAPGGVLPAEAAATIPGSPPNTAHASLLWTQDPGGVKEWLLCNGVLHLKSTGATPAWQVLSSVAGATAPPNPLSVLSRWGLYLVAVEQTVPWRIRFTNVDAAGPNFLIWPANNYLDMSTTDPVTTLKGIFNLLYAGKASGWHGISGVLGTLASVRELAIGNGPIDQRAASVTTDNRVAYWPLQKVPAFWNGERVSLVDDQRMDPRTTWLDATPSWARKGQNAGGASPAQGTGFPTLLRNVGTTWAASAPVTSPGVDGRYMALPATAGTDDRAPGWTPVSYGALAPQGTVGGQWAADQGASPYTSFHPTVAFTGYLRITIAGVATLPAGTGLRLMLNGVELCRGMLAADNGSVVLSVGRRTWQPTDHLSVEFFNPTGATLVTNRSTTNYTWSPLFEVNPDPGLAANQEFAAPAAGAWDVESRQAGYSGTAYPITMCITKNGLPISPLYPISSTSAPFLMTATNVAFALGDRLSTFGARFDRYPAGATLPFIDGAEDTCVPMLRATSRSTSQIVGTLGMFGDSVVVTPTEKRLLMAGDDGATTKVWSYGGGIWTHHEHDVLIAGLAPSDVKMSYLLPEHVVWATKRSYTAEPLKVWSINHDIDRPAFVSDQWASPYDQGMKSGDVLVRGQFSLPMWFDGQGRQSRVRSVIVQFVKWNQGIADGVNQISARVDSIGPYDRGITQGVETLWSEAMSGAAATDEGTEDSWRFNVGEQGFGNGFQLVFTALYGVAIREVVVLVDIRTDRT